MKPYQDQEWLTEAYQARSIYQIAKECGVGPTTIRKYMKRYGIQARSISEATKASYQQDDRLEKRRKQWHSKEFREKQSKITNSHKEQSRETSKKLWQNSEFARKCRLAHAKKMKSQEVCQAVSKGVKAKWNDPAYRKKQSSWTEQKRKVLSRTATRLWKCAEYRKSKIEANKKNGELRRLSTAEFIRRAKQKHGDAFSYDMVSYVDYDRTRIDITCNLCGHLFQQIPGNHLDGSKCPRCRVSTGQREIYDFVSEHYDAVLCDREQIAPYEIDVWVPEKRLGIEYHGLRWHSYDGPETPEQKNRLQHKAILAHDRGIDLLQFYDYHWAEKRPIVESMILHKLGKSTRIHGRQTVAAGITKEEARSFFSENHLAGHRPASNNFGLIKDGEIISAISLSGKDGKLEVIRYATLLRHYVPGGLSKLLSYAIKLLDPLEIKTYIDLGVSSGTGYEAVGFELVDMTTPGYFYCLGDQRLSRQQCQKHRLFRLLGSQFRKDLSESANMFINGFRRAWTAGNLVAKISFDTAETNYDSRRAEKLAVS